MREKGIKIYAYSLERLPGNVVRMIDINIVSLYTNVFGFKCQYTAKQTDFKMAIFVQNVSQSAA